MPTWFEQLTGLAESDYETTQQSLNLEGQDLVSTTGERHGVGTLSIPTLAQLRQQHSAAGGRTTVETLTGDARSLHSRPEFAGATFQVASQFNLLEMVGPSVAPEDGVTRYATDFTQGPACAMAAGAATIYRNYLVDVDGQVGQSRDRQLDSLAPLGAALAERLGRPVSSLWSMENGYALCTADGLEAIADLLSELSDDDRDELRALVAVGWHQDVDVTDLPVDARHAVSQVFCSALPVSYGVRSTAWEPFARLVLEGCYEATLLAAAQASNRAVLLTRVGGGAFGNADDWIDDAIVRALSLVEDAGLDVRLVSHGWTHPSFHRIASAW